MNRPATVGDLLFAIVLLIFCFELVLFWKVVWLFVLWFIWIKNKGSKPEAPKAKDDWTKSDRNTILQVLMYARHRLTVHPESGIQGIVSKKRVQKIINGLEREFENPIVDHSSALHNARQ